MFVDRLDFHDCDGFFVLYTLKEDISDMDKLYCCVGNENIDNQETPKHFSRKSVKRIINGRK